ncbi:histidine protein methyltransferase 1 homolog [Polyodon spathula]|uniref:histidine protein methyltransferase 1 homolog n=1 Tax=Polyodon spathula TaxID=7913 RepID=UPI001B7E5417|nr:histidine protein methyltransferase 1 homolog [Polyodon spathula]
MAFSFNFDVGVEADPPLLSAAEEKPKLEKEVRRQEDENKEAGKHQDSTVETGVKKAKEHIPPQDCEHLLENTVTETFSLGTLPPIHYLNESVLEQTASERADREMILSQNIGSHSDLISGVYEGGLRIWECTIDLLEHLESEGETFSGKRVLDLGCGAGLLGILALKRGAKEVHFQDYNSTVIEEMTLPNVLLNCDDADEEGNSDSAASKKKSPELPPQVGLARCRFFSGDWTSFLSLVLSSEPHPQYDLIFTSETIYNTAYYPSLHEVLLQLLAPAGLVYLATKAHYFGVGGGLHLFESFVEQKDVFNIKSLKEVEEGLKRHVVALSFKKRD